MANSNRRRVTLLDLLVLIAATGVGLALVAHFHPRVRGSRSKSDSHPKRALHYDG